MKTFFIRTATAVLLIGYVIGMLVLEYFFSAKCGSIFGDLLILSFGLLALYEMYKSFAKAEIYMFRLPLFVLGVTMYPVFYLMEHFCGTGLVGLFISFLFSAALAIGMFAFSTDRPLSDLLSTIFAMVYPFMMLASAYVISIRYCAIFAIVFAVFMPVFCDSMAYWVGSTVKGPKLCPKISPKKTISGAIGGLLGAMIAAVVMFLFFEYFNVLPNIGYVPFTDTPWKSALIYLAIGFVGGIVSQVGDIAASKIKRCIGVKDYGNIFPGHGGAMDRIDSIMYTLVLLLIAFTIVYSV